MGPNEIKEEPYEKKEHKNTIRNLIKLFEDVSKPIAAPQSNIKSKINEIKKSSISKAIDIAKQTKLERISSIENELENCVSVKSIIYNFQKMTKETTVPVTNKVINIKKQEVDKKESSDSSKKSQLDTYNKKLPTAPSNQKSNSTSAMENERSTYIVNEKIKSDEESSISDHEKREYSFISVDDTSNNNLLSDDNVSSYSISDDDTDEPLGKGITPLPDSYKLSKGNKFEIILPPAPKKSGFRKSNKKKVVKFKDTPDVSDTYSHLEYTRALEDLDVIGATAEYEFEKTYERMKKIEFTINREHNEKLGLQVYGLCIRSQTNKNNMAIYVKSVSPGSLCEKSGYIHNDDLIIEINGESLIGVEVAKVAETIRNAGSKLHFKIGRDLEEVNG